MSISNSISFIQQQNIQQVMQQYGSPLYVYNGNKIVEQYKRLVSAFDGVKLKLKYAMKANNNLHILRLLRSQGCGLDAVSIQEVQLGLMAGFSADEILFTPNSVSFEEILEAVNLGVQVNIDNISLLEKFGHQYGSSVPCCIRINPHIVAGGTSHIQTGHIDSKFGISIHQLRHVSRIIEKEKIRVNGLHMHTGSEIKDISVFLQALDVMLDLATHFPEIKYLDLGSGFKVPYKPDEKATDVDLLGIKLKEALSVFKNETGKDLEVWFEPGKYLVSESGYFIAKVNVIKQTPATVFVGINTGFNHLIRPMFYDSYHQIINISNPKGTERIYTVVGNLCETDTFCWDRVVFQCVKN